MMQCIFKKKKKEILRIVNIIYYFKSYKGFQLLFFPPSWQQIEVIGVLGGPNSACFKRTEANEAKKTAARAEERESCC